MICKDMGLIYSEYILNFLQYRDILQEKKLNGFAETFYNCREQGYVLNIYNENYEKHLYIWVYGHRNSDKPTIVYGKEKKADNMFTDEEWRNQKSFINIDDAVDYIEKLIESVFGE